MPRPTAFAPLATAFAPLATTLPTALAPLAIAPPTALAPLAIAPPTFLTPFHALPAISGIPFNILKFVLRRATAPLKALAGSEAIFVANLPAGLRTVLYIPLPRVWTPETAPFHTLPRPRLATSRAIDPTPILP